MPGGEPDEGRAGEDQQVGLGAVDDAGAVDRDHRTDDHEHLREHRGHPRGPGAGGAADLGDQRLPQRGGHAEEHRDQRDDQHHRDGRRDIGTRGPHRVADPGPGGQVGHDEAGSGAGRGTQEQHQQRFDEEQREQLAALETAEAGEGDLGTPGGSQLAARGRHRDGSDQQERHGQQTGGPRGGGEPDHGHDAPDDHHGQQEQGQQRAPARPRPLQGAGPQPRPRAAHGLPGGRRNSS